jgi:hypothetical protein
MEVKIFGKEAKAKAIVLPIRISSDDQMHGVGLAFHFLIGNILVLNSWLDEMWFGWRVKSIFPQPEHLLSYCHNQSLELDFFKLRESQNIRY